MQGKVFQEKVITVSCSCFLFLEFWILFSFYTTNFFVCGDVELNIGPKKGTPATVCQSVINSITAHNFAKVNVLQAYNAIHDFDMICLSESYLDSFVSSDNDNLYIRDYKLVSMNITDS